MDCWHNQESTTQGDLVGRDSFRRRDFFKPGMSAFAAFAPTVRAARAGASSVRRWSNTNGFRRIGVASGGSFEGERLSGKVVSGNDWQAVRTDSCIKLDVRLLLKTSDGALIVMTYTCLQADPPDMIDKLDKGEPVDPGSYYFRMTPIFETGAPPYDWINRIIAVGAGHRLADGPLYNIFEVL